MAIATRLPTISTSRRSPPGGRRIRAVSGADRVYGPGTRNVDIALVRVFRFSTHQIEARLESFNLLNWTRYNNPGTNFNAPNTFGRITSAQDPRMMQFALKYSF